ncbi:hypothetical protein SAMN05216232_1815 [Virgibacillus subterraneus]|uniref:LysM domain-containing protein n=2 Tax=Virgibacillus TaxID=84406 RepID=A0A1H1BCE7_9BACI|nr:MULTISPECIES: hypothetical protein [Virgibacillus]SDQ49540.1 hypothetical protein SAMN05216231_1697 [Virgibacillus salinus]SEQ18488.1 hypothetical protein SAMN05216232_1815 [Virgibacillus subterraneus]
MNNILKTFIYILIALFFISIYKDLSIGTTLTSINKTKQPQEEYVTNTKNISVMEVKVHHGDTLLTIVEKINPQLTNNLDVTKIVADFKVLNPTVDPKKLQPNEFYSFPIYEKEADN